MPRGLIAYRVGLTNSLVPPSSVVIPPGPNAASRTMAAWAAGFTTAIYIAGTYTYETNLIVPSGKQLIGAGSTQTLITPQPGFPAGGADDPLNAMILCRGALTPAVMNTTLTAQAFGDSQQTQIAVAATGTLAAGGWLALIGHNNPANEVAGISSGDNIVLTEIAKSLSIVAGPAINLTGQVIQNHTVNNGGVGTACSVQAVTPHLNAYFEGFTLNASGFTVADGILFDYAAGPGVVDIAVQGFSRFPLELRLGTRDFVLQGIRRIAETNGLAWFNSAMCGVMRDIRCNASGLRFHASGIARALIMGTQRPTFIRVEEGLLCNGCVGIRHIGGVAMAFASLQIQDFDIAQARATDPMLAGAVAGVGVESAEGVDIINNETALGCTYDDLHLSNCRHQSIALNCSWYVHDLHEGQIANCSIDNDGVSPNTAGRLMTGMYLQDCSVSIDCLRIRGCEETLRMTGGEMGYEFSNCEFEATAGFGAGLVCIRVNSGPAVGVPRFTRVVISNFAFPLFFDANFIASPQWNFGITEYDSGSGVFDDTMVFLNNSGGTLNPADVAEMDPASAASTRRLVNTGGPTSLNVAVASQAATGNYLLATPLPARRATVNVLGAANCGDILEANAANQAVPNNLAVLHTELGRILETKGAGAAPVIVGMGE